MFKKLDISLQYSDIEYENKVSEYAYTSVEADGVKKPSICFHNFVGDVKNQMLSLIPEEYQNKFNVNVMDIIRYIEPHTDNNALCSVNFYVETSGERTIFFNPKEGVVGRPFRNKSNGRAFKLNDLTIAGSFVASPGEVWILDVKKPHAVIPSASTTKRRAIVLNTNDFSYQEVLDMIENKLKGE